MKPEALLLVAVALGVAWWVLRDEESPAEGSDATTATETASDPSGREAGAPSPPPPTPARFLRVGANINASRADFTTTRSIPNPELRGLPAFR